MKGAVEKKSVFLGWESKHYNINADGVSETYGLVSMCMKLRGIPF